MKNMNVYEFCRVFYKVNEIKLSLHTFNEDGSFTFKQVTFNDIYDSELWNYKDFEVLQVKATKRNALDIIATKDLRKEQ